MNMDATTRQLTKYKDAEGVRFALSTALGRRFVSNLLSQTGIYRSSFSTDALTMAFSEGARNFGLKLLTQLTTHAPESYQLLLKENANGN